MNDAVGPGVGGGPMSWICLDRLFRWLSPVVVVVLIYKCFFLYYFDFIERDYCPQMTCYDSLVLFLPVYSPIEANHYGNSIKDGDLSSKNWLASLTHVN